MHKMRSVWLIVLAYLFPGPAGWLSAGVGLLSLLNSSGGSGSPSNGYGSGAPIYQPTDQGGADTTWQNLLQYLQNSTQQSNNNAMPALQQSFDRQWGMDYSPLIAAANRSGQASQMQGNDAMSNAGLLDRAAMDAYNKGGTTFDAGLTTYLNSLDPQNALYQRTAQQLGDQVNAGQAMRGLGNSAQGLGEYDQAMSNFNIDWQNNELARQLQGMHALTAGNDSSNRSNQLMGADLTGANGMLGTAASSYLASGQTPLTAEQTAAAAPGQAAISYLQGIQGLNNLDTAAMQQILGYLGYGQNASSQAGTAFQQQQGFNAGQTSAGTNALVQGLSNPAVKGWLTNMGGGNSVSSDQISSWSPTAPLPSGGW